MPWHGSYLLGGRTFDFRMKPSFPKTLSAEFVLVDLVNNVEQLAENREDVLARVRERVGSYDKARPERAVRAYGGLRTKKLFPVSTITRSSAT